MCICLVWNPCGIFFVYFCFSSQVVSCLLIFPLTIALGVLLGWHIYLTLRNKTTIEVCIHHIDILTSSLLFSCRMVLHFIVYIQFSIMKESELCGLRRREEKCTYILMI